MTVQNQADQSGPEASFIRQARRAQLVDTAISAIADLGLPLASTVVIARRAGVSRGVLTYHFRDRGDLLDAVVTEVYRVARAEVGPNVEAADSPWDALQAFVWGSIEFYARHPDHMAALSAIFGAGHHRAGSPRDAQEDHHRELDELAVFLSAGQSAGCFRAFDVTLMTASIRALLDVALVRVRAGDGPELLREEFTATVAAMVGAAL